MKNGDILVFKKTNLKPCKLYGYFYSERNHLVSKEWLDCEWKIKNISDKYVVTLTDKNNRTLHFSCSTVEYLLEKKHSMEIE